MRRLLAEDAALSELEVQRAGLSDAFIELTRDRVIGVGEGTSILPHTGALLLMSAGFLLLAARRLSRAQRS